MTLIKFVHKKPAKRDPDFKGLLIYYSRMDIILGLLLIVFSAFFIFKYFEYSISKPIGNAPMVASQFITSKPASHGQK